MTVKALGGRWAEFFKRRRGEMGVGIRCATLVKRSTHASKGVGCVWDGPCALFLASFFFASASGVHSNITVKTTEKKSCEAGGIGVCVCVSVVVNAHHGTVCNKGGNALEGGCFWGYSVGRTQSKTDEELSFGRRRKRCCFFVFWWGGGLSRTEKTKGFVVIFFGG